MLDDPRVEIVLKFAGDGYAEHEAYSWRVGLLEATLEATRGATREGSLEAAREGRPNRRPSARQNICNFPDIAQVVK